MIEDATELQQKHVVPFEARKAGKNGHGEVTIRDLFRWNTESISPDGKVEGRFEAVNAPTFADQAKIAGAEL